MVAVCNRAGHYIFALWFLLSSFFLVFPRLTLAVTDWMSTILHTWCGLSANFNLECRSEMCCTRLTENTAHKNRQKFAIWAPLHNLSGYIFATKACIDNQKKNVKQPYLFHMPHNMVNFGPLMAENCWRV